MRAGITCGEIRPAGIFADALIACTGNSLLKSVGLDNAGSEEMRVPADNAGRCWNEMTSGTYGAAIKETKTIPATAATAVRHPALVRDRPGSKICAMRSELCLI